MSTAAFRAIAYRPGKLVLLDQTRLPLVETYVELTTLEAVACAIERLVVRGAPAIGIAAAFGVALARREGISAAEADRRLRRTRPTAVNLFFALDRIALAAAVDDSAESLELEAQRIYDEDVAASRRMGELGEPLIPDGATVLTHCNAGALATAELGTALAIIRAAHARKKRIRVIADETRPLLQGARLTTWELMRDGIDVTLIPDVAVAHLLFEGAIDLAIVGADRIASNGDVANKVGTRGVACLLQHHARPLYVAAPWSTVDLRIASGKEIPIEERSPDEVVMMGGVRIAPLNVGVRNPAFDITPAAWISAIVTDRGLVRPSQGERLTDLRESA